MCLVILISSLDRKCYYCKQEVLSELTGNSTERGVVGSCVLPGGCQRDVFVGEGKGHRVRV